MFTSPNQTRASMQVLEDIATRVVYQNKRDLPERASLLWLAEQLTDGELKLIAKDPWFKFVALKPNTLSCAKFMQAHVQAKMESI